MFRTQVPTQLGENWGSRCICLKNTAECNRVLQHSTGTDIQYLVITYNGKESENKLYAYMCVYN